MGSVVSGVTNAVGGLVNGITGGLGAIGQGLGIGPGGNVSGQDALDQIKARALEAQAAQQAQLTGLAPQQTQFGQMLADQAMGKTDSPQLRAITERALKNQMGMMRANRSTNAGLASRQAAQAGSQLGTALGQQAIQDQGQFANYLQGQQAYNSNLLSGGGQAARDLYSAQTAKRASDQGIVGNLMNTGASMAAMLSDKNQKKNIKAVVLSDENQKTDVKKVPFIDMIQQPVSSKGYFNNDLFAALTSPEAVQANQKKMMSAMNPMDKVKDLMKNPAAITSVGGNAVGPAVAPEALAAGAPEMASLLAASDKNMKKNISKAVAKKQNAPIVDSHRPQAPYKGKETDLLPGHNKNVENDMTQAEYKKAYQTVSDEKQKKDVKVQNPKSFLDALTAYSYEYKNPSLPGAGPGRHVSVMAQDLEKAGPVGKSMVQETPNGKMVDYGKGFAQLLANQVMLNEQLKKKGQ